VTDATAGAGTSPERLRAAVARQRGNEPEALRLLSRAEEGFAAGFTWVKPASELVAYSQPMMIVADYGNPRYVERARIGRAKADVENLKNACKRYESYGKGWQAAVKGGLASSILLIRYERFCTDPAFWAEKMFGFLGLEFNESFLHFQPRFPNVYGHSPARAYVDEYKRHLPDEICRRILARTKKFSDWRW